MAGFVEDESDEAIAHINIVPFVDISLVLLIIFMLTSNIIARASIPVDLPRAAAGNEAVAATVNIVVMASGELFLDGAKVAPEELVAQIALREKADPHLRAVIAADQAVRYEHVVWVIDSLKQAGVDAFALNVEHKDR